jgi:hypothetical protein
MFSFLPLSHIYARPVFTGGFRCGLRPALDLWKTELSVPAWPLLTVWAIPFDSWKTCSCVSSMQRVLAEFTPGQPNRRQ